MEKTINLKEREPIMKLRVKRIVKVKTKKLANSFKYAFEGFITSFRTERNMKIHILIMLLVILLGILLKINMYEWIICVILFSAVIAAELFNTAIETTVDMISLEKSPQAKLAKDISAGAVLVLAIASAIIGLIIFIPKFIALF